MAHQVQAPGYSNALRRIFGLVGGFRTRLDPIIVPTVQVDDATPEKWLKASGGFSFTAAAGNLGAITLRNPAPSGKIIDIEYAIAFSPVADTWQVRIATGAAPGVIVGVQGNVRDGRFFPLNAPAAELWFTDGAAVAGSNIAQLAFAAGVPERLPLGVTLAPDQNLTLYNGQLNQFMMVSYFWRERLEAPEEPTLAFG